MADRSAIFAGLVGEVANGLAEYTEAAPINIAAHVLVAFGNALAKPGGDGPYFFISGTRHSTNEFLLVVGPTSTGRKGEAKNCALLPLEEAESDWGLCRVQSGLSSSEGLIHAVRDPVFSENKKGEPICVDEGVQDKRLLIVESEFALVLRQADRVGNTLSPLLRDVWDRKRMLRTLTRSPLKATGPLISLIGHSTREDLEEHATSTDARNGFLNRFLILETKRTQELPIPPTIPDSVRDALALSIGDAISSAREVCEVRLSRAADARFRNAYPRLSREILGIVGALLSRGPAHVRRLAVIYALARRAKEVDEEDIESALAFWSACADSVRSIFGTKTGDPMADRILREMPSGSEYTLTKLRGKILGTGNIKAERLHQAIEAVLDSNPDEFAYTEEKSGGRPRFVLCRR